MTASHLTRAWSCTIRLVVEDDRRLVAAAEDLDALLARVDIVASRFRSDSALSVANARAGRPTPIPKLLVDLVAAALDGAAQTRGAVDPTVGLAMQRIGYDRDIAAIESFRPDSRPPVRSGRWQDVRLHREAGLLTVPVGTALDLGATAKSYVADLAASTLSRRYDTAVLVELGGDLAVGGHNPDGWCVRVAEREGDPGQLVLVRHGGLVTSTTTVRRWAHGDRTMHHIVDPRTGEPVDGPWRTVSVAADRAFDANVASTGAIVMGDSALDWLETRGLAARLVAQDGTIHTTASWPAARTLEVAR